MTAPGFLNAIKQSVDDKTYERNTISRLQAEVSRVQKKTYTNWINIYLKQCDMEVTDLYTDLCDGKRLMKLLELISSAKIGIPNKGVLRVHKIENVGRALAFVKSKVHLENIGAEDIVDGNPTLILGLIWTIILRFQIEEVILKTETQETGQKRSAKEALLLWCQRKTQGYPNVEVKDFSSSWRDGMAFGALLHSHEPTAIDISKFKPENAAENLTIAFKVAEECFEIPHMLDPQDVNVKRPDERSIMTYISSIYQILNKRRNKNKNANRVGKTINQAIELSSKINQYEVSIRALLQWIRTKTDFFSQSAKNLPPTLEEISNVLSEFTTYRRVTKAQKYEERVKLEELLFTISLLSRELKAKNYAPTDSDLKLSTISSAWETLGRAEHNYETAVREAYLRLEKLEALVHIFVNRASRREAWLTEIEGISSRLHQLTGTGVGDARKAETLRVEIESKEKRFRDLNQLVDNISQYNKYPRLDEIRKRNDVIQERWGAISGPKMRALLARLAFPQTRADLFTQLQLITSRINELEKQMTTPTKAESDAIKRNEDSIHFEVVQAALDRHGLAEAELGPLEKTLLQIRNAVVNLWKNAPPMQNESQEKASDFQKSDDAIRLLADVTDRGRIRKARLEALNSSYNLSASLIEERKWVGAKIDILASTAAQAQDPSTARDLQLAQRLCKKHQILESEVQAHEPIWLDLRRSTDQYLNRGAANDDSLAETRDVIRRQLAGIDGAWSHLKTQLQDRQKCLNECLESAQFYADADEASQWIQEKVNLVESSGILSEPVANQNDLMKALNLCGADSSSTAAQKRRLKYLGDEMKAFESNDMARLKYFSTVLCKPMDNKALKPELLIKAATEESSDIDSDVEDDSRGGVQRGSGTGTSTGVEGRAQAVARYKAKDPAGRDIDVEKGEIVAVIAIANKDWWHVRRDVRGDKNEGFAPANRLRLLEAPVTRRQSSKKDAIKAVKLEVSRGLSIRRNPSARTDNELHFDRENIYKCEQKVTGEFGKLRKRVQARDNCLQDTHAWHDYIGKCEIFETWMKQKLEQLSRDQKALKSHGENGIHFESSVDEIAKATPLLAEIDELADILTGVIQPSKRSIYKRADGELFYKALVANRNKGIHSQWDDLTKQKAAIEAKLASSGSTSEFEKHASTLELLLGDRVAQLEAMPNAAPNVEANAELLRRVKAIQIESPALREKMSRLKTLGSSVMHSHPNDVPTIKSRLDGLDGLWNHLQGLLKTKSDTYASVMAVLSLNGKISDLDGKLIETGDQINELNPTDEVVAGQSTLQSLLPPDELGQKIRKVDDLDDLLTLYDGAAVELCDAAHTLPDSNAEKTKLCSDTDALSLRNEELKRSLETKKDALGGAIKAQNFNRALGAIEGKIKVIDTRLRITEPLASASDLDREKKRVNGLKLEIMKNTTAIGICEDRIKASQLPSDYAAALQAKCKDLRGFASDVMKKAKAREGELEQVGVHIDFHDELGDLEEWLAEKRVVVKSIKMSDPAGTSTGGMAVENLRRIRVKIKKLGDIDAELVANTKAVDGLLERATKLPQVRDATNFPAPRACVDELSRGIAALRDDIRDQLKNLAGQEAAAQFNNEADQIIKAVNVDPQLSAPPGEDFDDMTHTRVPQNLAEAIAALNDVQRRKQKTLDDLTQLQDVENRARKAGVFTPELEAQLNRERERLQKHLKDLEDEEKRNKDLVEWYKSAEEMKDLKDWADAQTIQMEADIRDSGTGRTPREHNIQRQKLERIRKEANRKDPCVKQLLDAKLLPIPACLVNDANAERLRPDLLRSWGGLQRSLGGRGEQLNTAAEVVDLLGELVTMTENINGKSGAIDRLVMAKSTDGIDPATKKILDFEKEAKDLEPKVEALASRADNVLVSPNMQSTLKKPLKHGKQDMVGAFRDLKDKINAAKQSLSFQKRIYVFDEDAEDRQQYITNALAFVSAIDLGGDPEQLEKLRNRWKDFLGKLPQLVDDVDNCLADGRKLTADLGSLLHSSPQNDKTSASASELTVSAMSSRPQMTYPLCNEQSVRAGMEAVGTQMERLGRDKKLLQDQVRLIQGGIDHTDDIANFNLLWTDLMELIKCRSARLAALCALAPKSISTLKVQVKKHEDMETELVRIQQQVDEVSNRGQEVLAALKRTNSQGGNQPLKTEKLVSAHIKTLGAAWNNLNKKMGERRQMLNDCNQYLQFSDEVRDFLLWSSEAQTDIALIEPISKRAAADFTSIDEKLSPRVQLNGKASGIKRAESGVASKSVDLSQAEILRASHHRMTTELQQHWRPICMQLVADAEKMIEANHYAAGELKDKVDRIAVAQREVDSKLQDSNIWILQLLDLLLLKRELNVFISQTMVQRARIESIIRECSATSSSPKDAACERLTTSLDVTNMHNRVCNITRVFQTNDEKLASLVSSANLVIQKQHFASQEISEVIKTIQIVRNDVATMCTDLLNSLERRRGQLVWNDNANDVEGWLTEREGELANLTTETTPSKGAKSQQESAADAVMMQLNMLQRQDKFQNAILTEEKHIDEILSQGTTLVAEEDKIFGKSKSPIGRGITERCKKIDSRWKALKAALLSTSAALEASRNLLRYQSEADALERWLREKDILLAKSDLGSDYHHCLSLMEKIQEPAAGKTVNDSTIRDFQALAKTISHGLRQPRSGTHDSVVALNSQTADFVDARTADISNRWKRVQEGLGVYAKQLEQASVIHEVSSKIDGLLIQINDRKAKAVISDDLQKALPASELELLLRALAAAERDVTAIETQTQKIKSEAEGLTKPLTQSTNAQQDTFIKQITKKLKLLDSLIEETKGSQQKRRALLESKLSAQRIIEGCHQLTEWSNAVVKELRPHIVGAAMAGLTGKISEMLAAKSGTGPSRETLADDEKRKAFIGRLRRRLTDCNSELPLRKQQLARLKSQPQQEASLEGRVIPGELAQADEALGRAAEVLKRLEIQVEIEEKRQAFSAAGRQEDRWIDAVKSQARNAAIGVSRALKTDSDSSGEEDDQPMIKVTLSDGEQHAAPPPSEMSPQSCLALLDSLSSSLEDRNALKTKFDDLQKYHADPATPKEIYTADKMNEDQQLLDRTQSKNATTAQMIATLRAQIAGRADIDNWFASANDSLQWLQDNQAIAAATYDWQVTLKRFGVRVDGAAANDQSCGPNGSGGMTRKMAAHRRFLVDIEVGLDMVDSICTKGQELRTQVPKKASKIDQITVDMKKEAGRLRDICAERTRRLNESNELAKWGQLMDEAVAVARQTEGQMMSDDYQMDEQGLKRLLEKNELIMKDIFESQTARADDLLLTATKAEQNGSFAGQHMVKEAKQLENLVKTTLPQVAQARLEAIKIMITWRRLERNIQSENTWLQEQLASPIVSGKSEPNLDYATATKRLKQLSEMAVRSTAQNAKIEEIVQGVKRMTNDDSGQAKSISKDLGTIEEASRAANQLMNQKAELDNRIGTAGAKLVIDFNFLQYIHDIEEAGEWMRSHMSPASKLAPQTDANGTKVASQNVSHLQGDLEAFHKSTITPLSVRIQQRAHEDDVGKASPTTARDEQVKAVVGQDLQNLILKSQGHMDIRFPKDVEATLDRHMAQLMMQYEALSVYFELVESRLKIRNRMHVYNGQADEFSKFLGTLDSDISAKNYGSDLEECEMLLSKFNERLERTSSAGAQQLDNLTNSSQKFSLNVGKLLERIDREAGGSRKNNSDACFGAVSMTCELGVLTDGIKDDLRIVQARQTDSVQNWATARTGMKKIKEALQSAIQIHGYTSDVDDLLEWIAAKSPQARGAKIGVALMGRVASLKAKRPELNIQTATGLEKAVTEQEKLRREVNAMQKQVDKQESEGKRLMQEYPEKADDVRQLWSSLQTAWAALQRMVSADRQRITEAQRVTEWQNRCQLLIGWADERRLAIQAVREIPTDRDEAQHLVTEHKQIRTQFSKKNPEKEEIIRSGQALASSIPSSKIVIQKAIEKLEATWSQMQSVWATRNGLYEKNLDLRNLFAEMTRLEEWLDDQEERLERTTNIISSNVSMATVDQAMVSQTDIEKAIADAKERFEAIKRKTLMETLAFEILKFAAKRSDGGGQPFSNARVAEIQRRETSRINRDKSRKVSNAAAVAAATAVNVQKTENPAEDSIGNIFGSGQVDTIREHNESLQHSAIPATPEFFAASDTNNDSFGMTTAQFSRTWSDVSDADDIEAVTSKKVIIPKASDKSPAAEIASPMSPASKRSSFGFMGIFKKSSGGSVDHDAPPSSSSSANSATRKGGNFFAKMRSLSREGSTHKHRNAAEDVGKTASRDSRVVEAPASVLKPVDREGKPENRPYSLAMPLTPTRETGDSRRISDLPPLSGRAPTTQESWPITTPDSSRNGAAVGAQEGTKRPEMVGSMARKVLNAPRSYRGTSKKWIPNGQSPAFNWAVLEGTKLTFYENEGASTIGTQILASFNVGGATVVECPPKTSKSHAFSLQVTLVDGTEMLLATNTDENLERWLPRLQTAAGSVGVELGSLGGTLGRQSTASEDGSRNGFWTIPRRSSGKHEEVSTERVKHGTWNRISRRIRRTSTDRKH